MDHIYFFTSSEIRQPMTCDADSSPVCGPEQHTVSCAVHVSVLCVYLTL